MNTAKMKAIALWGALEVCGTKEQEIALLRLSLLQQDKDTRHNCADDILVAADGNDTLLTDRATAACINAGMSA